MFNFLIRSSVVPHLQIDDGRITLAELAAVRVPDPDRKRFESRVRRRPGSSRVHQRRLQESGEEVQLRAEEQDEEEGSRLHQGPASVVRTMQNGRPLPPQLALPALRLFRQEGALFHRRQLRGMFWVRSRFNGETAVVLFRGRFWVRWLFVKHPPFTL